MSVPPGTGRIARTGPSTVASETGSTSGSPWPRSSAASTVPRSIVRTAPPSVPTRSAGTDGSSSSAAAPGTDHDATRSRVGTLFIDEGFGSLDQRSLEVAVAALEALQDTGRQVGIISHVERLATRAGARVVVRKTNLRSTVTVEARGAG